MNDDGFADVIVGAPYYNLPGPGGAGAGKAYVYSGQDGVLLYSWTGFATDGEPHFGWSVAGAGDVDNDGFPDVIVGRPGTTINSQTRDAHTYSPAPWSRFPLCPRGCSPPSWWL